jgi:hypothetical protein
VNSTRLAKLAPCEEERRADIGEDQTALRVEIGRRLAVLVGADLAGDEQKFRRFDAGQLRILPERLAEAVGVENLNRHWLKLPRCP